MTSAGPAPLSPTWSAHRPGWLLGPAEDGPKLYVGDLSACRAGGPDLAVIHAAKHPCHQRVVTYPAGSAPGEHPHYLALEDGADLFLNMIDAPTPKYFRAELFGYARAFVAAQRAAGRSVLIHCNQGLSRAPGVALVVLAGEGILPADDYATAAQWFTRLYPFYAPGEGLRQFLAAEWRALLR
jgi:predicted protein tyrosine phosphatase